MTEKLFPLVADGEPMLTPMPQMNLYDDSDLISNILGDYVEKNYLDWQPIAGGTQAPHPTNLREELKPTKTYAELAREEARADLKKKRSAAYLRSDAPAKTHNFSKKQKVTSKPTALLVKEEAGKFTRLGQNLHQDNYILADIAPTYNREQQIQPTEKPKKNNYDFLKKSQIYNQKEQPSQRERKIAQELNLTQLDDQN